MEFVIRAFASISLWVIGFVTPKLIQAENSIICMSDSLKDNVTFVMQNLSFLVGIIAGLVAIYHWKNKNEKEE